MVDSISRAPSLPTHWNAKVSRQAYQITAGEGPGKGAKPLRGLRDRRGGFLVEVSSYTEDVVRVRTAQRSPVSSLLGEGVTERLAAY